MSFRVSHVRWPWQAVAARSVVLAVVFLCAGCAGQNQKLPLHREFSPLPSGSLCRVAVLPFQNDSEIPQAGTMVSKVFAAEFRQAGDYQLLQEGDVLKAYRQLKIYPGRAPGLEQMRIIADQVNAQLLITGAILEMREDPGMYATVIPKAVMEVQIRDGRSGETLWTVYHRRLGSDYTKTMHFGTIHSLAGLSRQMAVEIINLWFEKGLPQCNVF